jgi:predicted branched-subunit amino acid permease
MAAFGIAFGAVAAQKQFAFADATLMSALAFAGASQFVAVEIWRYPMGAGDVLAVTVISAMINMRFILMSASLRPWLGGLPAWQIYPSLSVMTDPGWLMVMRYRAEGGSDAAVFFASGLLLWIVWTFSTACGHALAALLGDTTRFGIDLVMPCFFMAMAVPLWRGLRRAVPWGVAGAVALIVAALVPGWWFIMAGALAGCATAGLLDADD